MSIAAMEREIKSQPEDLVRFFNWMRKNPVALSNPSTTTFTGSGDSYAAAIFARELTRGLASADDPYELSTDLARTRNRSIVLISTSGRTRANIELARKARGKAKRIIAVTSNLESPLARICDSSVFLQYRKSGTLTSGTASFTASLLACAGLLRRLPGRLRLESRFEKARELARSVQLSTSGLCLFVGSGIDRALAEYGACKVQEVLGTKAFAVYPQQVGHAQLFSLKPNRDTVLCIDTYGKGKTWALFRELSRSGFKVHRISVKGKDVLSKSIAVSFYLQHLALFNAKKRGMTECAFLRDKARLELSNRLIYWIWRAGLGWSRDAR